MEPKGSLPHSQVTATCPYPEPDQSSPLFRIPFPENPSLLSSHLRLCLPSGLSPPGIPTKTLYAPLLSPIHATFPAHLILLDLITRTIFGEHYKSLSSSLCSYLHSTPLLPRPSSAHIYSSVPYSQTPSTGTLKFLLRNTLRIAVYVYRIGRLGTVRIKGA